MTEAEHRAFPDDYEAQVGQGPITLHSEEHLASTDKGLVMLRWMLMKQVEAVAEGRDPVGVRFDPDPPPETTHGGNFLVES